MPFITQSGSKQFIVNPGQRFAVDRINNRKEGEVFEMPLLLAFGDESIQKKLEVKVIAHAKGKKIRVVKYKSKSNYHRQYGFRPYQTVLEVISGKTEANKTKTQNKDVTSADSNEVKTISKKSLSKDTKKTGTNTKIKSSSSKTKIKSETSKTK